MKTIIPVLLILISGYKAAPPVFTSFYAPTYGYHHPLYHNPYGSSDWNNIYHKTFWYCPHGTKFDAKSKTCLYGTTKIEYLGSSPDNIENNETPDSGVYATNELIPEPSISEIQNRIPPTLKESEETMSEDELDGYDYYDEYEKPLDEKMSDDEIELGIRSFQLG